MANSKITNLTSGSPAQSGDEIPVNRGGADRKITVGDIATSGLVRELLTADRSYYVRSDGSDSNNGLANTSAGAFLTIQKAFDTVAALDFGIYNVTVNVGAGTFAAAQIQGPVPGYGTLTVAMAGVDTTFINPDILTFFNALKFVGPIGGVGNFHDTQVNGGFTINASGGNGCTYINAQNKAKVLINNAIKVVGDSSDTIYEAEYHAILAHIGGLTIGSPGCGQIGFATDLSELTYQGGITLTSTPNICAFGSGSGAWEADATSVCGFYFTSITGTATGYKARAGTHSFTYCSSHANASWPGDLAPVTDNSSFLSDTAGVWQDNGSITTSKPHDRRQTWNASGVTFTGLKLNITNTASAAASALMDLQIGGSSIFKARKDGTLINTTDTYFRRNAAANWAFGDSDAASPVAQTLSVQNVVAGTSNTAGANFTIAGSQGTGSAAGGNIIFQFAPLGTAGTSQNALGTALTITGGSGNNSKSSCVKLTASTTNGSGSWILRAGDDGTGAGLWFEAGNGGTAYQHFNTAGFSQPSGAYIGWKSSTIGIDTSGLPDTYLIRKGAANLALGAADAAAPVAQTLSVQNVVAGTSNTAGTDFTLSMSQGTGTGAGGGFILKVAPAGTTGTSQNALAQVFKIDSTKSLTGGVKVVEYDIGSAIYGDVVTPDPSNGPMQKYTNSGDHVLTPGSNYGYYLVTITNDQYAGSIDTSGWTKVTGDAFDATDTHKFRCAGSITSSASLLVVTALQ